MAPPYSPATDSKKRRQRWTATARGPDALALSRHAPGAEPSRCGVTGRGYDPLLRAERLGKRLGLNHLYIKDESLNPTGSFKARGLALAIARAAELGVTRVAIPSAGNARRCDGGVCRACRAGVIRLHATGCAARLYRRVPDQRAHVELVDGLITDAGRRVAAGRDEYGWFDLSTLKEPYRVEGKKTMGYEIAEQFDWELPQVIIYPTGGGTGLIGMWKSFDEMEALGWIDSHRPRMVSVQAAGCAPIVRAFESGATHAEPWQNAATMAAGLRVPSAVGDALMLRALRESEGTAIAVSEAEILWGVKEIGQSEGLFVCPEGGAALAGLRRLVEQGWIDRGERVVLFNTGSGLKYLDALPAELG